MAKKQKEQVGRIIYINDADNKLLKRYLLEMEESGSQLSKANLCNNIFSDGLHAAYNELMKLKQ